MCKLYGKTLFVDIIATNKYFKVEKLSSVSYVAHFNVKTVEVGDQSTTFWIKTNDSVCHFIQIFAVTCTS